MPSLNTDILVLMPVRKYIPSSDSIGAYKRFLKIAAETDNDGFTKRAHAFMEHVAPRLGAEAFGGDQQKLLEDLKEEMRKWALNFHTDAKKVVTFAKENPAVLGLPLGRLLGVSAVPKYLFGLLADAIDSIVVRMVWRPPTEELNKALKKKLGYIQNVIPTMEVFGKDIDYKYEELLGLTYNYLDALTRTWVEHTDPNALTSANLLTYMEENPPDASRVPVNQKLDMLYKSNILSFADISNIVKAVGPSASVGDVVDEVLDSAIKQDALRWYGAVGSQIDWKRRRDTVMEETDEKTTQHQTVNLRRSPPQSAEQPATPPPAAQPQVDRSKETVEYKRPK